MRKSPVVLLAVVLGVIPAAAPAGSDPADPLEPCRQNEVFAKLLQIQTQLETLIALEQDPGKQSDLRLRLAEIFIQQASGCPQAEAALREQAVKLYRHILAAHPGYERRGEVLYHLAITLTELHRTQDALKIHKQIVRDGGKYVPDSLVAFAEHYFQQNDMARAQALYERAVRFKDAEIYSYALYKLGWVRFNLQRWKEAARCFARVIEHIDRRPSSSREVLREEALKDFVRAYSRYGDMRRAPAVFAKLAKNRVRPMLERLARILADDGMDKQAIAVNRHLIESAPDDLAAARSQFQIIEITARHGDKQKQRLLEEVRSFGGMLRRARCNRSQLSAEDRESLASLATDAKAFFDRLLSVWTREGLKIAPGSYGPADDLNALVREMFP